jgi:hypothetical protein
VEKKIGEKTHEEVCNEGFIEGELNGKEEEEGEII